MEDDVRLQDDPLVTPNEVGKLFGVQARTVVIWIKDGKLEGLKTPSGRWRVRTSEMKRLAAEMYGGTPQ